MTVKEFEDFANAEVVKEMEIMFTKGKEYTISDEDKLKNFKSVAERVGMRPQQVALIYLLKHIDSICNYVQTGKEASDEPIAGRFRDARNYLLLLRAIVGEEQRLSQAGAGRVLVDVEQTLMRKDQWHGA